jgi:hypothetical protein
LDASTFETCARGPKVSATAFKSLLLADFQSPPGGQTKFSHNQLYLNTKKMATCSDEKTEKETKKEKTASTPRPPPPQQGGGRGGPRAIFSRVDSKSHGCVVHFSQNETQNKQCHVNITDSVLFFFNLINFF